MHSVLLTFMLKRVREKLWELCIWPPYCDVNGTKEEKIYINIKTYIVLLCWGNSRSTICDDFVNSFVCKINIQKVIIVWKYETIFSLCKQFIRKKVTLGKHE